MKKKKGFLDWIEDFRLLPLWVVISMAAGIGIGKTTS